MPWLRIEPATSRSQVDHHHHCATCLKSRRYGAMVAVTCISVRLENLQHTLLGMLRTQEARTRPNRSSHHLTSWLIIGHRHQQRRCSSSPRHSTIHGTCSLSNLGLEPNATRGDDDQTCLMHETCHDYHMMHTTVVRNAAPNATRSGLCRTNVYAVLFSTSHGASAAVPHLMCKQ
jgi:hypothetical protein